MKAFQCRIVGKIVGINGIILLCMAVALLYLFFEIGRGTLVIEKQAKTLSHLETTNAISNRFATLRYWLSDFAVGWLNDSQEQAKIIQKELEDLFVVLENTDGGLVQTLRPQVNDYVKVMLAAADAFIDDNRVLGNALVAEGRQYAAVVDARLSTFSSATEASTKAAGTAVIVGNLWMRKLSLILLAVATPLGFCVSWLLAQALTRPLKHMADVAYQLAVGNIDQEIAYQARDEIGMLADAFRALMDYIKGLAAAVDALSKNDLTVEVVPRSEQDVLSKNILSTIAALRDLADETQVLVHAAQAGKLHERGNTARFQGVYRELVQGINDTLEAVTAPMGEAREMLERLAARDLTARMTGTYHGEYVKIKNALNQAMENLDAELSKVAVSAQQVTTAAGQINSGSQALAQSASEQASTLEEVSSSLHELDSMSQQNAANAQEARSLVDSARHSADTGTTGMQRLSQAISEIKAASDKTAKIVKTIDEIAFQTNLLALNAAVEAARAGDAGRGFAVVAEEVRNLAMRSAEAAKTTAQLIDEAVHKTEDGVTLNHEVLRNLEEIVGQVHKVSEVMGEIAAASEQQQEGVRQLNTAVGQLNQVTQQTAANSEEAASAAHELSSQAAEMQHLVGTFQLNQQPAASSLAVRGAAARKAPRPVPALPAAPGPKAEMPMPARVAPGHRQPAAARAPLADVPYDHDEAEVLQEF